MWTGMCKTDRPVTSVGRRLKVLESPSLNRKNSRLPFPWVPTRHPMDPQLPLSAPIPFQLS
ncbi:hypothetical protein RSAG8_05118, partial [Rhizoctonia solani AG-8 WAC10335]